MMKGYVAASRNISVSERQLRALLPHISPQGHLGRTQASSERTNPTLYNARYFGHKLHVDQNEKLDHYGVTYVLARDGFFGKVVAGTVMPRKKNEIIFEQVFRPALVEYRLWNQVRVDHGHEFYLILYMQERLRQAGRGDPSIATYMQTSLTYNYIIERIWVELNSRDLSCQAGYNSNVRPGCYKHGLCSYQVLCVICSA